ncbi:hypothetical protein OHA98_25840 [Streptomyces sp. NBC_00654]|uniref:hypothetical protein n=1 Tax=Streptomyces sp. NBC_00654 TaxID=2975799 RepID=UPI0022575E89|nr:hypothetical protein [Streptomyces sp. NBC_00654]MCX4968118.1 hypothetical protein [Streptomyces sp. NBC_00654]
MVSVTHRAHDIEVTAESLQEDLARLMIQKQALERELAAVVAHLSSVQRALGALQTLMSPAGSAPSGTVGTSPGHRSGTAAHGEPLPRTPAVPPADAAATAGRPSPGPGRGAGSTAAPEEHGPAPVSSPEAGGQKQYGRLTEQILEYFAGVGDVEVRARDVAAALGRATDSSSINAVRSTLDRLVGTSRVRRTGRGLYRAV